MRLGKATVKGAPRSHRLAWACAVFLVVSVVPVPGAVAGLGGTVDGPQPLAAGAPWRTGGVAVGPTLQSVDTSAGALVLPPAPVMVKRAELPHAVWSAPEPPGRLGRLSARPVPTPSQPTGLLPPPASDRERPRLRSLPHVVPPVPLPAVPVPLPVPLPVPVINRLTSDDGSLDVRVDLYDDCSGTTLLTHAAAALDPCMTGVRYFLGHNPGVFSPLMHMGPGTLLTWRDGSGAAHIYRVISERDMAATAPRNPVRPDVVAQFQTCITLDGSVDRILDAVPA